MLSHHYYGRAVSLIYSDKKAESSFGRKCWVPKLSRVSDFESKNHFDVHFLGGFIVSFFKKK